MSTASTTVPQPAAAPAAPAPSAATATPWRDKLNGVLFVGLMSAAVMQLSLIHI